jgi:SnoaL-like domain
LFRSCPATILDGMEWIEIVDALYRFGLGQDSRDRDMFASAFAADAELDFQPAAGKWGGTSPLMTGRDTIVGTIFQVLKGVDTTHVVTNPRVSVDGDTARLTAIVEAQHLLADDHSRFALLKNFYTTGLVRAGDRWTLREIRIENYWYQGDPTFFFGPH